MRTITAYRFRIYPDAKRQSEIDKLLFLSQQFYNKLLELTIDGYTRNKQPVSMSALNKFAKNITEKDKTYLQLYSQTRCEIKYRLLRAYQNFFRRINRGDKKKGFPRFKSIGRYKSITYPQDNGSFSIEKGRLRVSRIGTMKIELHRAMKGTVKTLSIKKYAGDYYAIFTTANEIKVQQIKDTNPVGIDLGLENFITLSDGEKIKKPQFMRTNHKKISHWEKVVSRRQKDSKRREKAKKKLENAYINSNMLNTDFMHKLTKDLVENRGYTSFALEDLPIANMLLNHKLARSIHNASWGIFKQILSYKAENAGMEITEVNPRFTTQKCSKCGNIKGGGEKLALKDRIYRCDKCHLVIDRDVNAAINVRNAGILKRATAGHAGSHARGDTVNTMQQALQTVSLNREHTLESDIVDSKGSLRL